GIRDFHVTGVQTCALPISDTSSYDRMRLLAYILMAGGLIGLLLSIYFLPWRKLQVPSRQSLINLSDTSLMLLLSTIFILGTALTAGDSFTSFLRRDPPAIAVTLATLGIGFLSPISILSALALAIFAILVFNRPILGLMSVAFWSMFFTTRI